MRIWIGLALALVATPALAQDRPAIPPEVLEMARRPVALTLPGMEKVQATRDLDYAGRPQPHLRMDVYRPPGLKPGERRPVVLFIHGGVPAGAPAKEMGAYRSWGRLAAASGLLGVTFTQRLSWPETRLEDGAADVRAALAYVRKHAAELNADPERVCLAAFSAGGPLLAPYIADAPAEVRCLVAFYPLMDPEASPPHRASEAPDTLAAFSPIKALATRGRKPPLYLARAGADEIPTLLEGLDRFTAAAKDAGYPLTLADNPGAPHSFDILAPTPRTLEILREALAFLTRQLTPP